MGAKFDMLVDYDTLCNIEYDLTRISQNLNDSTNQMVRAIQHSQGFLAGYQFEKAKKTTATCVETTNKTVNNIRFATDYISRLKNIIEEYGTCCYKG